MNESRDPATAVWQSGHDNIVHLGHKHPTSKVDAHEVCRRWCLLNAASLLLVQAFVGRKICVISTPLQSLLSAFSSLFGQRVSAECQPARFFREASEEIPRLRAREPCRELLLAERLRCCGGGEGAICWEWRCRGITHTQGVCTAFLRMSVLLRCRREKLCSLRSSGGHATLRMPPFDAFRSHWWRAAARASADPRAACVPAHASCESGSPLLPHAAVCYRIPVRLHGNFPMCISFSHIYVQVCCSRVAFFGVM